MIADKINTTVKLENVKNNPNIEEYDNIILGGAVIAGQVKNGMKKFLQNNSALLLTKNIILFVTCMDKRPDGIKEYFTKTFSEKLLAKSLLQVSLGGAYYPEKENFFLRTMFKAFGAKAGESFNQDNVAKIASEINNISL